MNSAIQDFFHLSIKLNVFKTSNFCNTALVTSHGNIVKLCIVQESSPRLLPSPTTYDAE